MHACIHFVPIASALCIAHAAVSNAGLNSFVCVNKAKHENTKTFYRADSNAYAKHTNHLNRCAHITSNVPHRARMLSSADDELAAQEAQRREWQRQQSRQGQEASCNKSVNALKCSSLFRAQLIASARRELDLRVSTLRACV
jgi:hypothetical protein